MKGLVLLDDVDRMLFLEKKTGMFPVSWNRQGDGKVHERRENH